MLCNTNVVKELTIQNTLFAEILYFCIMSLYIKLYWYFIRSIVDLSLDMSTFRCTYDVLVVYDGEGIAAKEEGRFCGTTFSEVVSTGRYMTLHFLSDDEDQFDGFQLHYFFEPVSSNYF
jgi:hypothetical protein